MVTTPKRQSVDATKQALMAYDIDAIKRDVSEIKNTMTVHYVQAHELQLVRLAMKEISDSFDKQQKTFVTQDQFWPVKTTIFGMWGFLGIAILGALVALVVRTGV